MHKVKNKKPMPNPEKALEEWARKNRRNFLAPYEARVNEIIKTNRKKVSDIDARAAKRPNRSLTPEEGNLKEKSSGIQKKKLPKS